jgi:hypothetical protein
MNINIELSDEISALSMDGASAIAMNLSRRLTKYSANNKVESRILENEERPVATVFVVDEGAFHNHKVEERWTNGENLIEEFSSTHEERQTRRENKHEQKSKSHGEQSSSCGMTKCNHDESELHKRESHVRKSKKHSKTSSKCDMLAIRESMQRNTEHEIGESSTTAPISEISAQSTNIYSEKNEQTTLSRYRASHHKRASDFLSYPSIVSTVDSYNSNSAGAATASSGHKQGCLNFSHSVNEAVREFSGRSLRSSSHTSPETRPSTTHRSLLSYNESTTEHSTHMSGPPSSANHSHITVEDVQKLQLKLRRARKEEEKVLRIHEQLVEEVGSAKTREDEAKYHQQNISLLFEAVSIEHEQLRRYLEELHNENKKLRDILSELEEREEEKSFVDFFDGMDAKMRSFKVKSQKLKNTNG